MIPNDGSLSKKAMRALEEELMTVQRELDEGTCEDYERNDPWAEREAFNRHLYDEKHIIKAFSQGILTAQRWKDDLFVMLPGYADTVQNIARHVQMMNDPKTGRIRMTMSDIVVHMRKWTQWDENFKGWVADGSLDADCVLRAACDVLEYERHHFRQNFNETLREARNEMAADKGLPAEVAKELNDQRPENSPPKQTPSGLHPAVS